MGKGGVLEKSGGVLILPLLEPFSEPLFFKQVVDCDHCFLREEGNDDRPDLLRMMVSHCVADYVKRRVDDPFPYITRRRRIFNEANEVSQIRFRRLKDVFHDEEAHERFGMSDPLPEGLVGKRGEVAEGMWIGWGREDLCSKIKAMRASSPSIRAPESRREVVRSLRVECARSSAMDSPGRDSRDEMSMGEVRDLSMGGIRLGRCCVPGPKTSLKNESWGVDDMDVFSLVSLLPIFWGDRSGNSREKEIKCQRKIMSLFREPSVMRSGK